MRRSVIATLFGLVATVVGCHQPQTGATAGSSVRNVITREEIDASRAQNVYELISQLRGSFLKDRGKVSLKTNTNNRAVVFMNDQEYGILETMRNIPIGRITEVRYYSGTDAVVKFGSRYGGGVVMLVSRAQ